MFDILSKVVNKVGTYTASTRFGKSYIKPELKEKIEKGRISISDAQKQLKAIQSIKRDHTISTALDNLAKQGHDLIDGLLAESILNSIVDIIGNHINEYESIDAFKQQVLKKTSIKEMQNFALKLIDLENYRKLATTMTNLQEFDSLNPSVQKKLFDSLQSGRLIANISHENANLDIHTIKLDIQKMSTNLCKDLRLTQQETKSLIDIFESLTNKHLIALNNIRQTFVRALPLLLKAEKARISATHPELCATQSLATNEPVIPNFEKNAKKSKTKPRAKSQPNNHKPKPRAKAQRNNHKPKRSTVTKRYKSRA